MVYSVTTITVVKVLHVLLAAVWVGASFLMSAVVGPQLLQATPSTRREFMGRLQPVNLRLANIVGGLVLLSGILLYYVTHDGFDVRTQSDRLLIMGFVGTLAILYLINFSLRPLLRAMAKLGAEAEPGEPPSRVMRLLQGRIKFTSILNMALMVLVLAIMVMANTHVLD